MSDIVERLRAWVYTDSQYATAREAADEIERLRKAPCPHVVGTTTHYCSLTPFTLTEKERKAIGWAIAECESMPVDLSREAADTLRSLLSRIGDCPVPENAANDDNESVRKTGGDLGQPSPAPAGSQPVAWAVAPRVDDEIDCEFVYPCEATAGDVALDAGGVVVPLYRSPAITADEREVLLAIEADAAYRAMWRTGQVVRGLLDRLE